MVFFLYLNSHFLTVSMAERWLQSRIIKLKIINNYINISLAWWIRYDCSRTWIRDESKAFRKDEDRRRIGKRRAGATPEAGGTPVMVLDCFVACLLGVTTYIHCMTLDWKWLYESAVCQRGWIQEIFCLCFGCNLILQQKTIDLVRDCWGLWHELIFLQFVFKCFKLFRVERCF